MAFLVHSTHIKFFIYHKQYCCEHIGRHLGGKEAGDADGPEPNGDGTSADAAITKFHILMGQLKSMNIVNILFI